jgi:hypothetical protein
VASRSLREVTVNDDLCGVPANAAAARSSNYSSRWTAVSERSGGRNSINETANRML